MKLRPQPVSAGAKPVRRKSHFAISMAEAENLSDGLNFARALRLEPNLLVTLQWLCAPSGVDAPDRIQMTINRAASWLRRRGVGMTWVYVREVGLKKGEHLHWLIFVPKRHHRAFTQKLRDWVEADTLGEVEARAVDARPTKGDLHRYLKRYLLKNGTDQVRRAFWVPASAKYRRTEGVTLGRRVKLSRSIDRAARARSGLLS